MNTFRRCTVLAMAIASAATASAIAAGPAVGRAFTDPGLTWDPCPDFMPKGCGIAVLGGSPAGRDADVFFRVPGNATIPLHWHSSAERMVLVSGRLRVAFEGHAPMRLMPGQYARGAARAPHSAVCESAEPCVLFIAFDGPVDANAGRASVGDKGG